MILKIIKTIKFTITIVAPVGVEFIYDIISPIIKVKIDMITLDITTLLNFLNISIDESVGNTMKAAYVNDRFEELNYVLKNKDRIIIITDKLSRGTKQEWEEIATTSLAKRRIRSISHP